MPSKQPELNKPSPARQALDEQRLNTAASGLLEQLPDHAGQLVHSLAKQYQMPLWQYTCGILLAVHLEGRLSEFRLDPAWRDGLKTKELTCKHCGKSFKPRHIGQPFCSNECGLLATGPEEIRKSLNKDSVHEPSDSIVATKHPATSNHSSPSGWSADAPGMAA